MAKILITTIQVNLVPNPSGGGNANSPELLLVKFLPLTYHHSHFLATTLDVFFHPGLFGDHTLFSQLGCFALDNKLHKEYYKLVGIIAKC